MAIKNEPNTEETITVTIGTIGGEQKTIRLNGCASTHSNVPDAGPASPAEITAS